MTEFVVHDSYAVVGSRRDIDGYVPQVVVDTNRNKGENEACVIVMTPRVARLLARQLNHWAKLVDPPKKKSA